MATLLGRPVVYRDGKPLAPATAAAFDRLAAGFKRDNPGYTLHVRWGLRTPAQQDALFRKYQGTSTVALRSTDPQAYHVITNPYGGRSIDIYDSGSTPGVTVRGTRRANWIKNNAAKYGFWARGYNFGEPWHIEFQGNPWAGASFSGTPEGATVALSDNDIKQIWYYPIHRKEGDIRVIQEIADIKTIVMDTHLKTTTPVKRGGKEISVRQDNADTNTFAREILDIVKDLQKEVADLKKKLK